jgi:hypothetical protein
VARMWKGGVFTGFRLGGPKGKDHWEDLGIGGRITLKWNLGRQGSKERTAFSWVRIGSSGGLCEHSNEPSFSIKETGCCLTS